MLGTANDLAGRPFCSQAELDARRQDGDVAVEEASPARELSPVMVYFDGKDYRTRKKVEEVLSAPATSRSRSSTSTDDESTRTWAPASGKQTEFPLVFIAGISVGGLHELTQLDVSGELLRRVRAG